MSTTTKSPASRGVRYTDAQKKEVIDFALNHNSVNGRGGQSKAAEKFKISQITIAAWLKGAGGAAPKAAKAAKASKASKSAKAPKGAGKSRTATRYTDAQKKEIVDFVTSYNASNGRGGQRKAAAKFNVSPLTVMAWLKAAGGKSKPAKVVIKGVRYMPPSRIAARAAKAAKLAKSGGPGGLDAKLATLLTLSKEITKTETILAQLNARFKSLKASL